jgi:hypothetical protein
LHGLECKIRTLEGEIEDCEYLFSASPIGDGFSASPEQNKEFTFVRCNKHGRFSAQPTDKILFTERSFTDQTGWPTGMKRQSVTYHCEGAEETSAFGFQVDSSKIQCFSQDKECVWFMKRKSNDGVFLDDHGVFQKAALPIDTLLGEYNHISLADAIEISKGWDSFDEVQEWLKKEAGY